MAARRRCPWRRRRLPEERRIAALVRSLRLARRLWRRAFCGDARQIRHQDPASSQRQTRQDRVVDLILAECRLILFEAKPPQPTFASMAAPQLASRCMIPQARQAEAFIVLVAPPGKRSDINSWDLFCFGAAVFIAPAGKRSDIDSENLTQSVPELRSLASGPAMQSEQPLRRKIRLLMRLAEADKQI